jgi:hypothetical protein
VATPNRAPSALKKTLKLKLETDWPVSILFYFKLLRTVREIKKTSDLRLLAAKTATGNILISTFLITARHGLDCKTAASAEVGRAPRARQGRRCHLPNQQEKD